MQYKDVVKAMFAKHKGQMPAKDIMKMAAAEYRKMNVGSGKKAGKKSAKGGAYDADMGYDPAYYRQAMEMADRLTSATGAGMRRKRKPRGAGIFGDIGNTVDSVGNLLGFGLEKKKGKKRGGYMSAGALSAGDFIEPQAMTPPKGAYAAVGFNPVALPNQTGGNLLSSVSHLLPLVALL